MAAPGMCRFERPLVSLLYAIESDRTSQTQSSRRVAPRGSPACIRRSMDEDTAETGSTEHRARDDALETLATAITHLGAARVSLSYAGKHALATRLHAHTIALSLHLEQGSVSVESKCCLDEDSVSQPEVMEATWTEELALATALATESASGNVWWEDAQLLQQESEMIFAAAGRARSTSVERRIGTSSRRSWIWSCSCQ